MPILSMRSVCNERHSLRIDMALVLAADSPDWHPARVRRLPSSESKLSLSIAGRANRGRSATPASLLKAAARAQPPLFSPHQPSPAPLSTRQRDGESDCPSRPWGDPVFVRSVSQPSPPLSSPRHPGPAQLCVPAGCPSVAYLPFQWPIRPYTTGVRIRVRIQLGARRPSCKLCADE